MTTEEAAPTAGPREGAPATSLDALDDSLVRIRRTLQRPGYRQRLLQGVSQEVELAVIRLLRAVQRADEPPSIGVLADVLAIDPSTASRVVERALDAGHLERRPCARDGRKALIQLTASGRTVLAEVTDRRRELLGEITGDWPDEELNLLVALLDRLQAGFDELEARA